MLIKVAVNKIYVETPLHKLPDNGIVAYALMQITFVMVLTNNNLFRNKNSIFNIWYTSF